MLSYTFAILALTASISAFNVWARQTSTCPSVWSDVAKELQTSFAGCGRDAHGAIRAPFHDCINNGCDGSLILTDECSRAENGGLSDICSKLMAWSTKYSVSAADMIQFAAAIAIAVCPLGPTVNARMLRRLAPYLAAGTLSTKSYLHSVQRAFPQTMLSRYSGRIRWLFKSMTTLRKLESRWTRRHPCTIPNFTLKPRMGQRRTACRATK
jgi:hypothetical protein